MDDIPPDILDRIVQDSMALEAEVAARISNFEPLVNDQYPLILKLCRRAAKDENEAADIAHDAFRKFFQQISTDNWSVSLRKFKTPEAWLRRVALNACADFRRERYQRRHGERPKKIQDTSVFPKPRFPFLYAHELPKIRDEDGHKRDVVESALESEFVSSRRNPEESTFDREILMRYLTALCLLTPLQRTVFVLCKDTLLQPEERDQLLGLDARTTRLLDELISARPNMLVADVARLLQRNIGTLSSELTRAKVRLRGEFADLRWRKSSELPVPSWSREFLAGFPGHRGSFRSFRLLLEERGELEETGWLISAGDKEYVRGRPGPRRKHENARTPAEDGHKGPNSRSMNKVPGWFKAPEPDDPEDVSLMNRIRGLRKAGKKWTTIAEELNAANVPSRFGPTWHPTGVRLLAERTGLAKKHTKSIASKDVLNRIRNLLEASKTWVAIAKELNAANVRVPARFNQIWQPSTVTWIAQRAGLMRKRSKLIAPKNVLNRIRDLLKAKQQWTTIAKHLNRAKVRVPRRFSQTWQPSTVRLIARRAGLMRKRSKLIAPKNVLNRIRNLLKAKKRWTTIAKRLTRAKVRVPRRFGQTWRPSAVRWIAQRAGLVRNHRKLIAPTYVLDKIRDLLEAKQQWTTIAKHLNRAKVRVPRRFNQPWQPSTVRLIAHRAGLVRKRSKLIAPTYVLDKIRDLLEAKKKWTTIANELNATNIRVPRRFRTWHPIVVRLIAKEAHLGE